MQLTFDDIVDLIYGDKKKLKGFRDATEKDRLELSAGRQRVLNLLKDGLWHTSAEVLRAAQGSEGLRRLRELRACGYKIEKRRTCDDSRTWEYRLA